MKKNSFLIIILNNVPGTSLEELRLSYAIFSPESKILPSTISAPVLGSVPQLTARLAGGSDAAGTKTAPIYSLICRAILPILTEKEKLNQN